MKKTSSKIIALLMGGTMLFSSGCDMAALLGGEQHKHSYTQKVASAEYLKSEATCKEIAQYYFSCSCGEKGTKSFEQGTKLDHNYTAEVAEAKYLKHAATCESYAEYYKSCVSCGQRMFGENAETFFVEVYGEHKFTEEVHEAMYIKEEATFESAAVYYKSCACGVMGEETFSYGEPLRVLTEEEKKNYQPTSITMSFYDAASSVYGFTYNTASEPMRPVLRIAEGDSIGDNYVDYPVRSEVQTSIGADDLLMIYYVSKVEVPLVAGTKYTYQVRDEYAQTSTEAFTFTAKDPTSTKFSFAHVGDTQVDGGSSLYFGNLLRGGAADTDFILHTGDVVEKAKYEHEWETILNGNASYVATMPMMAIMGNHEGDYSGYHGTDEIVKHFNYMLPQQASTEKGAYYSFTYGNAKFIMLNANDRDSSRQLKKEQYDWLVSELENNTATWTIVAMHQPCYSPGGYGSQLDGNKNAVALALQAQLRPVFAQYGVDLVLQGHDHVVSRTHAINSVGNVVAETWNTVDSINYSVDPDGVIYLETGPGGNQTRGPVSDADASLYKYMVSSKASSWSEISIDGNRLTVSVKYSTGTSTVSYDGCTWGIEKTA